MYPFDISKLVEMHAAQRVNWVISSEIIMLDSLYFPFELESIRYL